MQDAERRNSRSRWLVTETKSKKEDKRSSSTPDEQTEVAWISQEMMRNGDLSYVTLGAHGGRWRLKLWYYRGNCGVEEYRTQGVNEGPGVHRFRKSRGLEAGDC